MNEETNLFMTCILYWPLAYLLIGLILSYMAWYQEEIDTWGEAIGFVIAWPLAIYVMIRNKSLPKRNKKDDN